jgi:16S rRNA G966 N2-methylase RsmD
MLFEKFLRKIYAIEDFIFEKYYGFNFSGNISANDLVTSYVTKKNAVEYRPVFIGTLRQLFSEVGKLDSKYHNFIDIGSGKGKACFYALMKQSFKQVTGVEFSKELVDIAIKNQNIIGASNVNFLNMDASTYLLPDESSLIFLFNPFDQIVLEKFLKNNMDHFAVQNSVVAYANDVHRNVLAKMGFETIFRNQTRKISIYRMVT